MAKIQPIAFSPNAKWKANFKMKQFHLKIRSYDKKNVPVRAIFATGCNLGIITLITFHSISDVC